MKQPQHLYIAGPMSGISQMNFPAFDEVAAMYRKLGYYVTSPAELDSPEERQAALASKDGTMQGESWGVLLARDLKIIADGSIEAIVVLPGWEQSKGARLETFVGRLLGLPILAYPSLNAIEQYHLEYTHALPAPGILQPPRPPEGTNLSPGEAINWAGCVPIDTAESVQADREIEPLHECGIEPYQAPSDEWRERDARTGGEKNAKQAVLGDAAPETLTELARVYGFGRKKYDRLNYLKGYNWSLSYDAGMRHMLAFWERKENDEESGLHHLAHACWHCLTLMAFTKRNLGRDDRP